MRLKDVLLNGITIAAASAAVFVSLGVFRQGGTKPTPAAPKHPQPVAEWQQLLETGHRIGPCDAKVTVVEFGDFQCPACAQFAFVIDSMRAKYPNDFALVYHHLPLPYHRAARPLAYAAECAARRGKFVSFYAVAFAKQADLGIVTVDDIVAASGITDRRAFDDCVKDSVHVTAINNSIRLARDIGVSGTPAVLVNGALYDNASVFSVKALETLLADALSAPRHR